MQYRAFADDVRKLKVWVPEAGARAIFTLPMPKSWSKKKRENMRGRPHRQKPDVDNLCKALLDALYTDDCVVWDIAIRKIWGDEGSIEIERIG